MRQLKDNNKGLSLIEVLVAVIILAIVVTPFLHSFVTTANTNRKAKDIHKATVLAQSVVESCKAENLEDIALQFNYPDSGFRIVSAGNFSGGINVGELRYESTAPIPGYVNSMKYEDLTSWSTDEEKKSHTTASTFSKDGGATSEFLGQSDGYFYFQMNNVMQDTSVYDVLIQLDASKYHVVSGTPADTDYNDKELAQLPIIDEEQDALCMQRDMYTDNAASEFYGMYSSDASLTEDIIKKEMKREITVLIEKVTVGGNYTKVTTTYDYSYKHGTDETKHYIKEQHNFDSTETGHDLRCVYLYYYPLYADSTKRDTIIIKNDAGVPIDLYLFKQGRSSTAVPPDPNPTTAEQETKYKLDLRFTDLAGTTVSNMSTKLHSNLKKNIADSAGGTDLSLAGNLTVSLNGYNVPLADIDLNKTLNYDATDRAFDLDVSVYKQGAAAAGYPEDMKLTTMSGTKLK